MAKKDKSKTPAAKPTEKTVTPVVNETPATEEVVEVTPTEVVAEDTVVEAEVAPVAEVTAEETEVAEVAEEVAPVSLAERLANETPVPVAEEPAPKKAPSQKEAFDANIAKGRFAIWQGNHMIARALPNQVIKTEENYFEIAGVKYTYNALEFKFY